MKLSKLQEQYPEKKRSYKKFLKKFDKKFVPGLDDKVYELDEQVWEKTDCLSCGNCCKEMTPTFREDDIERIAAHLNYSIEDFKAKYLEKDDSDDWVNKSTPCQFLEADNKCRIYPLRPHDCATFPHHNERPIDEYNDLFKQNMKFCPATFSLVKKMKKYVEQNYDW